MGLIALKPTLIIGLGTFTLFGMKYNFMIWMIAVKNRIMINII